MNSFFEAINYPEKAFDRHNRVVSWVIVFITILINALFEQILKHFIRTTNPSISLSYTGRLFVLGILSYFVICFCLFIIGKCLGSERSFMEHIDAWGISFTPNILAVIVVALMETFFYIFWNNSLWGMIFGFLFIAILIWKTILYVIYLKKFVGLNSWKFWCAFIIIGVMIIILACLEGFLGLKTPII